MLLGLSYRYRKERQQYEQKLAALTEDIEDAEVFLERLQFSLEEAKDENDKAALAELQEEYEAVQAELAKLSDEWETTNNRLQ